ncbi:MAG TPA: sulfotransferase [Bacteroidales bacterium]|nr:sulfotransferase [Bacteroidales bacterium]
MNKSRINILVKGTFASGSSAVTDLLKEYDNIAVVPYEFNDFCYPQMVGDCIEDDRLLKIPTQEYTHEIIRRYGPRGWVIGDGKIKYALKKRLLRAKANESFMMYLLPQNIEDKINSLQTDYNHRQNIENLTKRYNLIDKLFSEIVKNNITRSERIEFANNWIQNIGKIYAINRKQVFVLFDQPIILEGHLDTWPEVFRPFKLIIVYRDPRDQIADLIQWNEIYIKHIPNDRDLLSAIQSTLKYIKREIYGAENVYNVLGIEKVMMISFEKFIKDNDLMTKKIQSFLGLNEINHKKKELFLQPKKSIKNIGIYKRILTKEQENLIEELYQWYINKERENVFYG